MATIFDQNFNGGGTLASLGFTAISYCSNLAGAGPDGSYAMSWDGVHDLADCKHAITMTTREMCFSGVWTPKVYSDWRVVAIDFFNGTGYVVDLQLYTDSAARQLFLQQRNGEEVWRSASNFFTINVPLYWRLYVKASTVSGGGWLNDGLVRFWTGPSAGALTEQVNATNALIEDSFGGAGSWNALTFGPQGILDDLFATDTLCVTVPTDDGGSPAGVCCHTSEPGVVSSDVPPPIGDVTPFVLTCTGSGQPDNNVLLADGEVF